MKKNLKANEFENVNTEWMYKGEATAFDRPINSLLEVDVDFRQSRHTGKQTEIQEDEIKLLVKERLREKKFDNFIFAIPKSDIDSSEEIKTEGTSLLSFEEIEEMIQLLDIELMQISDLNNHVCDYNVTKSNILKNKKVKAQKKEKDKVEKELKKYKNVEFVK